MTNDEYFNDKPMKEAIAKWRSDCENGYCGDVQDWLSAEFMDLAKGKIVRGSYYSNEEIEEKIRKMESVKVTGFLLEWQNESGTWFGSEFHPEKGTDSNLWCNNSMKDANDDWYKNEVTIGFFKELPTAWFEDSCDWYDRLGVDFDARTTPTDRPSPIDTWGDANERGELWRVRKITIDGTLSDKAKEFIRRNPDVEFDYAK